MKPNNKKLTIKEKKLEKVYKIFLLKLYFAYLVVATATLSYYFLFLSIVFPSVTQPPPSTIPFFMILSIPFFITQVIFSKRWFKYKKIPLGRFFIYNIAVGIFVLSFMMNVTYRNIYLFEALNINLFMTIMLMSFGMLLAVFFFTIFSRPIYALKLEPSLNISFILKIMPIIVFSIMFFFLIVRGSMYESQLDLKRNYNFHEKENKLILLTERLDNLVDSSIKDQNVISKYISLLNENSNITYETASQLIIENYINDIHGMQNNNNMSIKSIGLYLSKESILLQNPPSINSESYIEWDLNTMDVSTNKIAIMQSDVILGIAEERKPYVEIRYITEQSSILNIYSPILMDNEIKGIIVFRLLETSINKIIDEINLDKDSSIVILNADNILSYVYNEATKDVVNLLLEQGSKSRWANILSEKYIRLNSNIMLSDILDYSSSNDEFRLLKSSKDNLNFDILLIWRARSVQESIQSQTIMEISSVISLIALIFITIVIFLIMKMHQVQILKVGRATALLAKFGGDLTERVVVKSNDETGILAYGLNKFLEKISIIIETIKKNTSRIIECFNITDDIISENYSTTDKASKEFESEIKTIEKVSNLVHNASIVSNSQRRQFVSVNDSIQTLLKTVSNINGSMEDQAVAINETSASIHQMMSNIASVAQSAQQVNQFSQDLVTDAKSGSDIGEEVMEAIQHIKEASVQITDITKVIQVISEQTNLLAMNAAIEAAHAGEQGKGFAIVADKIRKLAEDTGENSKIIGGIVQDVTDSIEHTVSLAVQSSDSLEKILDSSTSVALLISEITNANSELDLGRRDILNVLKNLNQITFTVQNLSDEQTDISNKVGSQIASVDKLAEDVGLAVDNVNRETSGLLDSITSVSTLISYSKEQVNNLEISIDTMKKVFSNIDKLVNIFVTDEDVEKEIEITTSRKKRFVFHKLLNKFKRKK